MSASVMTPNVGAAYDREDIEVHFTHSLQG
jgi:hypothetical protein